MDYPNAARPREGRAASALADPARPMAAIVGGAKVSTKLQVLENLVTRVDALILGGGMANTFLLARGQDVGASLVEANMVDTARAIEASAAPPAAPPSTPLTPLSRLRPTTRLPEL